MTIIVCLNYENCVYLVGDAAISGTNLDGKPRPHQKNPLRLKLYPVPFSNSVLGFSGQVGDIQRFLALVATFVFSSVNAFSFDDGRLMHELPLILERCFQLCGKDYSLQFICAGLQPIVKPYQPITGKGLCSKFWINERTGKAIKLDIGRADAIGSGEHLLRLPSQRAMPETAGETQTHTDSTILESLYLAFDGMPSQYVVGHITSALNLIFKSASNDYIGVGGAYQLAHISEFGIREWLSDPNAYPDFSEIRRNESAAFIHYKDASGKESKKVLQYMWDDDWPDFL